MKKNLLLLISLFLINFSFGTIYYVGTSRTYTKPSAVVSLVSDGDTVYIDGGIYSNDAVKWTKKNLKLIGLGNAANPTILQYTGDIPNGKGIWVFEQPGKSDNAYIENITFDGAQVSDGNGGNGAGIRFQSVNLTVNKCHFSHCQNGILEGGSYTGSNVIIENSEFAYNGYNGSQSSLYGYEHQMYISAQTDTLIVKNCYIHDVHGQGHSLKTRAQRSYILYNMIDEAAGNGSYEIDIAQGGLVVAIGNVIIQGTADGNHTILCIEAITNPIEELYFVNNTIINKFAGNVRFMATIPSSGINAFKFYNNIFASVPGASNTVFSNNIPTVIDTARNVFVKDYTKLGFEDPVNNNYKLLPSSTILIDKGSPCGNTLEEYSLTPEYMCENYNVALMPRTISGAGIDIGAYEYTGNVGIIDQSINNEQLSVMVYPNPVQLSSVISLQSSEKGNITLKLYDIYGRLVRKEEHMFNNDKILFDRSTLPSGTYFYSILSRKNNIIAKGKILVE